MITVRSYVFSPLQENTYLLYNEHKQAILIDPGCYFPAEVNELKAFIEANGLTVERLVQTHCHLDHVFGTLWAAKHYGLTPAIHPLEEEMMAIAPESGQKWGLTFKGYEGPFEYLEEGGKLLLGDESFGILHVPGHSPGSICFHHSRQGFLIGGDVLFKGSIGRTDLFKGDHQQLIDGIRTQLFRLPDATIVHSGHGMPTNIGTEKKTNPYVRG